MTARSRAIEHESDANGRGNAEKKERSKCIEELWITFKRLNAKILEEPNQSNNPIRVVLMLAADRRASTFKARVREWKRSQFWMMSTRGVRYPEAPTHICDSWQAPSELFCGASVGFGQNNKLPQLVVHLLDLCHVVDPHPIILRGCVQESGTTDVSK